MVDTKRGPSNNSIEILVFIHMIDTDGMSRVGMRPVQRTVAMSLAYALDFFFSSWFSEYFSGGIFKAII
jgi:hypothetical protein